MTTASAKVKVYSMNNCPYCVQAKNLLSQRGIAYEEIKTDDWPDQEWDNLVKKSGMKSLPQIYVGEKLIGGYSQLAEVDAKDKLINLK